MQKFFAAVAALVSMGLLQSVCAVESSNQGQPLVATALDSFVKEADQIRHDMKPGGHYEFIKAQDKQKVEKRLNDMEKLMQTSAGEADMHKDQKIQLLNMQEEVNAILKHNDSDRLVCESRAPVGSHLPVTTCKTYGQIESERNQTNTSLREYEKQHQTFSSPQSH